MGNRNGSGNMDMFDLIQFERSPDGKIVNIGEKQRVVEVIRLDLKQSVKKALDFEFCSGVFVVHDVTEECKDRTCKIPGCTENAQVLEARLVAVTTKEGDDYLLGEIEPESREILSGTRKRVRICYEHKLESLLSGSQAEDFEEMDELPERDNVVELRGLKKRPLVAMEDPRAIRDMLMMANSGRNVTRKKANDNGKSIPRPKGEKWDLKTFSKASKPGLAKRPAKKNPNPPKDK